jgi:CDP-paratose 2-epimerase
LRTFLITGGAGFIGCNAAARWSRHGWRVVVLDDLSRRGSQLNLDWLQSSTSAEFHRMDITDADAVMRLFTSVQPDVILHLAGQVAVTTSLIDPRRDFEVNASGTFNLLEATRSVRPSALFLYASTNKVYGRMDSLGVEERNGR